MANGRLAQMRVGVLGSGEVGRRLAEGFCGRGHEVMIGSRDPDKPELREWLSGDGAGIEAGTFEQAAAHGELIVLAVLGSAAEEAIADAGPENFTRQGRDRRDEPARLLRRLSAQALDLRARTRSANASSARCPTPRWSRRSTRSAIPYFVDPSFSEGQPTMLIAGDDEEAKDTVGNVLADFGWSDTVDIGGIEGSRELEAICIVWVKIGGARGAWDHGFKLLAG